MKDPTHHMKKLNRKVIRSEHREEMQEENWAGPSPYAKKQTVSELKKQVKRETRKIREERTPVPKTPEEKNRLMKRRVPVFDRLNNAKPKMGARTTKKKTPRI
jgi:hypothetical protein